MLHRGDLELVRAAQGGDFSAFSKLYALYLPAIGGFAASRTASPDEALELTRSILVTVFDHLDGYSGRVPFAALVLVIARKVCENRLVSASDRVALRA